MEELNNLTFGEAIEAMKSGYKVARKGWNGKGVFIYLVHCGKYAPGPVDESGKNTIVKKVDKQPDYIAMHTATGGIQQGWLASQADILANDWESIE